MQLSSLLTAAYPPCFQNILMRDLKTSYRALRFLHQTLGNAFLNDSML